MYNKINIEDNAIFLEENIKKFILPYYNIKNAVVEEIKYKDTDKHRAVYKITCSDGQYCLKKVYYGPSELLFVYSAIEWWYRHNINVTKILPTYTYGRFVTINDMLFILTPWIDGRKCDYDKINYFLKSGSNLGKMHFSGLNFTPIVGSTFKTFESKVYNTINKHFLNLLKFSNLAFKYKDKFSKIYLKDFHKVLDIAQLSTTVSCNIDESKLTKSLCHYDYVSKNILLDSYDDLWVIDFDTCKFGYIAQDIAYGLRRYLRRSSTCWNFENTILWFDSYTKYMELSFDDYKYIFAYVIFPQKFWRISRDYYRNIDKCNKKSFCYLLEENILQLDLQLSFTNKLKNHIENKFSKKID